MRTHISVSQRRKELEKKLRITLPNIAHYTIDETQASIRNCENMIGAIQVPLGIAGPLPVMSGGVIKKYMIPLATTEGALIASVNRGCKALAQNDGVTVTCKRVGITRAPVFAVKGISQGQQLVVWAQDHLDEFKDITASTSSHLALLDVKPWVVGTNVFLRFRFDSQEAMGMNMATIACDAMVKYIEKNTKAVCVALSGNMCVDKKPNFLNFIEGRGYSVSADACISKNTLATVLKTTSYRMHEVTQRKLLYGSILSGSIGANAHTANVLAAIFLATGQDIAHIAECAASVTTVELRENDGIYISIYLPDLVVGTIGGGTELKTQQESLGIMGITQGQKDSGQQLAEIIGGSVLAGELSLIASLAEGSLATAHQKLGRNKR